MNKALSGQANGCNGNKKTRKANNGAGFSVFGFWAKSLPIVCPVLRGDSTYLEHAVGHIQRWDLPLYRS